MSNPIYTPKGRAGEYAPDGLAINIYDSCPHGCTYCYARDMAKRFGKPWGDVVSPRPIEDALRAELAAAQARIAKLEAVKDAILESCSEDELRLMHKFTRIYDALREAGEKP